jgi:hypothetical protein
MLPAPAQGSQLSAFPDKPSIDELCFFLLPDGRMDDDFDMYVVRTRYVLDFSAPTVRKCGSMDLVDDDECLTWTEKVGWVSGPSPSPSFQ